MFQAGVSEEHRQAVLDGINRFFDLAGVNPLDHYDILDPTLPGKYAVPDWDWLHDPYDSFVAELPEVRLVKTLDSSDFLAEVGLWGKEHSVIPLICVDSPIYHHFSDGSSSHVYGLCSLVDPTCVVTTDEAGSKRTPSATNARIASTIFHELGHDFGLSPAERAFTLSDTTGSHCECPNCAMNKYVTAEFLSLWEEERTPLCIPCLFDMAISFLR